MQALLIRIGGHQRLELADQLGVAAKLEFGVDSLDLRR